MHILLNGIHAASNYRGWGRYGVELLAAFARIDSHNRYSVYYIDGPGCRERLETHCSAPNFELSGFPESAGLLSDSELASLLEEHYPDVDIYHCMTEFPHRMRNPGTVITIHELTRMSAPKNRTLEERCCFEASIREALDIAKAIVVVSEHTRMDLYRCFPDLNLPVHRIWNGVAEDFLKRSDDNDAEVPDEPGQSPFVLFVGAVDDPDKNFSFLIDGLVQVDPHCALAVVTRDHDTRSLIENFAIPKSLANKLRVLVDIPDARLAELYRRCKLFVFPSYHEGFGLPVVEAMACGAPVLCSRNSSLVEIAEGYCQMFETDNLPDFVDQLRRCLSAYPSQLIKRARAHASTAFDWEACARAHLDVYESVVTRSQPSRL